MLMVWIVVVIIAVFSPHL